MPCGRDRRRTSFPCAQLLFCLACLSMAGWTWMRYSYAWEMSVKEITLGFGSLPVERREREKSIGDHSLYDRYVRTEYYTVSGATIIHDFERNAHVCGELLVEDEAGGFYPHITDAEDVGCTDQPWDENDFIIAVRFPINDLERHDRCGWVGNVRGRLGVASSYEDVPIMLDATASRLHGASISGLVVGAMGCFIFGLYLRRWVLDRKAA